MTLDPVELTRDLIAIDSVNPDLVPGGAGERVIAAHLTHLLARHGFETRMLGRTAGRESVLAIAPGSGGGRSVMLNGHLDTVSLASYDGDGLKPVERGGTLHGRGAYDMKSGIAAAVCAAIEASASPHRGDIVLALVADEEYASTGTEDVLQEYVPDAAIVVEPSELDIVTAHRGFTWAEITFYGMAAHGSRRDLGIDAITAAGRVLTGIRAIDTALTGADPHPLLGTGSIHASTIHGGTEASTYPDRCVLLLERRTLPGETAATLTAELAPHLHAAEQAVPGSRPTVRISAERDAFAADDGSEVVGQLEASVYAVTGSAPRQRGEPFWTDCALLAAAGTDTALFGVAGGGAHAADEWVDTKSIRTVGRTLSHAIRHLSNWHR